MLIDDLTCRDADCEERRCKGCPERNHRHLADGHLCTRCLHGLRLDLERIDDLLARMPAQAMHGARGGRPLAAAAIPGGDALVVLAPCADPEARGHLADSVAAGRVRGDITGGDSIDSDPLHPGEALSAYRHHIADDGSVAKIVKLEHAWRRLDGRNDDGFQVAPFPG